MHAIVANVADRARAPRSAQKLLRRDRQLADPFAGRVIDRGDDRRGDSAQAELGDALDPDRAEAAIVRWARTASPARPLLRICGGGPSLLGREFPGGIARKGHGYP